MPQAPQYRAQRHRLDEAQTMPVHLLRPEVQQRLVRTLCGIWLTIRDLLISNLLVKGNEFIECSTSENDNTF
jgi:hypothetical protein